MYEALENVVARCFELSSSEIDDHLAPADVPAWDSMGHLALVTELEAIYGVSLTPDEILGIASVGDIRTLLREHGVVI